MEVTNLIDIHTREELYRRYLNNHFVDYKNISYIRGKYRLE